MGLQLWSIKDDVKQDFKGTLTQVANMGFKGVEFAGDYGPYKNNGKGLKNFLNSLGLTGSAAHIRFKDFNEENFNRSVAFFRDAGIDTLIVPWDDRAWDKHKIQALVTDLNQLAAQLTREGFKFGYHNHDEEFNAYGNATFWDHIARTTAQDFVLQMDVGWVTYAEHNPLTYIKRYPGRTLTTHFKAKLPEQEIKGKRAIIGDDVTDWASVIKADIAHGGTQWFIVEQEEYPDGLTPLEAVKLSKRGLDKIIANLEL
ncbi:sugar phosphate isomerase/epimerase [Thalassomonas actiniarum]|uniref:Sugar phosphate isomerase/epimerase n=1 Tax=Thalassomonas actiniarum TaxID=485447 RepID=A0AAF0C426_9GAMM|nr:sugar phosphate isomerase/epimerase [Thalassomonas actiniarum]